MASLSIPCDFCSVLIPREDFECGKAVTVLKKHYCPKCMAAAVERSKTHNATPSPVFQTPRPTPLSDLQRNRRRHERKDCSIRVELSVYLENGQLYDRGNAVLWNVSLSGALLRALVLPEKALPLEPHHVGMRMLDGALENLRILGRPVRLVHAEDGLHLAVEFTKTEEAQIKQLRKFL